MLLIDAVKIIRNELLRRDEPLKAYNLLKELNLPELKPMLDNTYGMLRHMFDPEIYHKSYGMAGEDQIPDSELIEPRILVREAKGCYPRYDWMLSEMDAEKPESYMDLACYMGSLVTSAAAKGIKAYGVDMTKRAIELATERAAEAGLEATFFLDDITKFDKVKADLVSAFEVIEHVVDPEQFIKHLCSLANKWVYITTPNGSFDDGRGNEGHLNWDGVELHLRGHVRAFRKESMIRLLDKCGCEIAFVEAMPDNLIWAKFRRKDEQSN